MTHGGAGRGQGRKSLARKTKGMRVWVPIANDSEAHIVNNLSPQARRRLLLGEGARPVYTFRYDTLSITQTDAAGIREIDGLSAVDLSQEIANAIANGDAAEAYTITIFEDDIPKPFSATAVCIISENRVGIEWGAGAQWMDSTGDIEKDIDMWLNDPDQFESRN